MIDIFNETYNDLVGALAGLVDESNCSSMHVNMPTEFPFVSLEEIGNSVNQRGMDCCEIENFSDIDFEINIYTRGDTRKTNAKEILQVVDTFFRQLGFIRMSKNEIQEDNGATYHIIVRYSAVVSKDHIVYRR